MNRQLIIKTVLATIAGAVILAAGIHYFVSPALRAGLVRPPAPQSPAMPGQTAVQDLLAMSRERIQGGETMPFDPPGVWRNPFIWPEGQRLLLAAEKPVVIEKDPEYPMEEDEDDPDEGNGKEKAEEIAARYRIKVIMTAEGRNMSLINRSVVFEGDALDENRVLTIKPLSVILETPDQEQVTLAMTPPPGMIAYARSTARKTPAEESPAVTPIPAEGDSAGQLRYLREELLKTQNAYEGD
jgi:hypothetical protein